MRQYTNQKASGTVMSTQAIKEPLDNVIERVMAIAKRVVSTESAVKSLSQKIARLEAQNEALSAEIETLKVEDKPVPKTTTAKTRKTTTS